MKSENVEKIKQAESLIQNAIQILGDVYDSETWGTGKSDVAYFRNQLEEFISCDNGEAGLSAYIGRVS